MVCWEHMKARIDKCERIQTHMNAITSDLIKIQLSTSEEQFKAAIDLFLQKWESNQYSDTCTSSIVHRSQIDSFLKYFKKMWGPEGSHPNWYEGSQPGLPSTNNAQESSNRWFKKTHLDNKRWPIARFVKIFKDQFSDQVVQDVTLSSNNWRTNPEIEPKMWTDAWHMSRTGVKTIDIKNRDGTILTYIHASNQKELIMESIKKHRAENLKSETLQDHFNHQSRMKVVKFNKENYLESECSCSYHSKHMICKHVLYLQILKDSSVVPTRIKSIPIGKSAKRGRPCNSKRAYEMQPDECQDESEPKRK